MIGNNLSSLILCLIALIIRSTNGKFCHDPNNTKIDCDGIFQVVHKCHSDFVDHALNSSDPFIMCTNNFTFLAYRLTVKFYDKLLTTFDPHNNSVLCSDKFLNKNRMNVISSLIGNTKNLWEAANCDGCYNESASTAQNYSRNTAEFIESLKLHNGCLRNVTHGTNSSLVCRECGARYQTLNGLYERIKKSAGGKICFDLEDKMNKTRRDWSVVYKCCKDRRDSLTAFYSLSSAILIIAVSFYCAVYYVGMKYPSTETLDEREISRTAGHNEEATSSAGTSSSRPARRAKNPKKELNINNDDSDDEILIGNVPQNVNLIGLN